MILCCIFIFFNCKFTFCSLYFHLLQFVEEVQKGMRSCFHVNLTINMGITGGGMDVNLALCAMAEGAGSVCRRIYSLGHPCPRCQDVNKVKSGPQDLLLWKELSRSDIENSHGIYIQRDNKHIVPETNFPFFDEIMNSKPMHFHRGNRYYVRGTGWKEFVNDKKLQEGDTIRIFWLKCQNCEEVRGFMMKAYIRFY